MFHVGAPVATSTASSTTNDLGSIVAKKGVVKDATKNDDGT